MIVKIEPLAGFCFGVVSAINLVEKELKDNDKLYCLGDIVHNNMEVERLSKLGLEVIDIERMKALKNTILKMEIFVPESVCIEVSARQLKRKVSKSMKTII